jgi:ribonuclease BN (tRNA processing enzyme)
MMRVTLLGTRGSMPAPGRATAHYGGNTPSVAVCSSDGTQLVLDAGTGICRLVGDIPEDTTRIDILLTHLHMDHIQGLGFFGPLYHPGIAIHIWGPASSTLPLDSRLTRYLSPPLFPVHLRDLPSVTCHDVPGPAFEIGPFSIRAQLICHPNTTVGYRIEADGAILAYLPDHEPALGHRNGDWLEPEWTSGHELAVGADLLIHDAQFTDEQYAERVGWGHSTYRQTFEFAARVGAKQVVLFHHDPSHDDATLERMLEQAMQRFKPPCKVLCGSEGAVFELGRKVRAKKAV